MRNINLFWAQEADQSDIDALSVEEFDILDALLKEDSERIKSISQKLSAGKSKKWSDRIKERLLEERKDTGTIHLYETGFDVKATIPKKVDWDTDQLDKVGRAMKPEDARHYIKTTHTVEEKKYESAPPEIKAMLDKARTVKAGTVKIEISPLAKEAAE